MPISHAGILIAATWLLNCGVPSADFSQSTVRAALIGCFPQHARNTARMITHSPERQSLELPASSLAVISDPTTASSSSSTSSNDMPFPDAHADVDSDEDELEPDKSVEAELQKRYAEIPLEVEPRLDHDTGGSTFDAVISTFTSDDCGGDDSSAQAKFNPLLKLNDQSFIHCSQVVKWHQQKRVLNDEVQKKLSADRLERVKPQIRLNDPLPPRSIQEYCLLFVRYQSELRLVRVQSALQIPGQRSRPRFIAWPFEESYSNHALASMVLYDLEVVDINSSSASSSSSTLSSSPSSSLSSSLPFSSTSSPSSTSDSPMTSSITWFTQTYNYVQMLINKSTVVRLVLPTERHHHPTRMAVEISTAALVDAQTLFSTGFQSQSDSLPAVSVTSSTASANAKTKAAAKPAGVRGKKQRLVSNAASSARNVSTPWIDSRVVTSKTLSEFARSDSGFSVDDFCREMKVVITFTHGFLPGTVFSIKRRGIPSCVVIVDCDSLSPSTRISVSPRSMIPLDSFLRQLDMLNDGLDEDS